MDPSKRQADHGHTEKNKVPRSPGIRTPRDVPTTTSARSLNPGSSGGGGHISRKHKAKDPKLQNLTIPKIRRAIHGDAALDCDEMDEVGPENPSISSRKPPRRVHFDADGDSVGGDADVDEIDPVANDASTYTTDIWTTIMPQAHRVIRDAKMRRPHFIPLRVARHMPNYESLIRPVRGTSCLLFSQRMLQLGFRSYEPIVMTDLIPVYGICRRILAGNHRTSAARDSSRTAVTANLVLYSEVVELAVHVENAWDATDGLQRDTLTRKVALYTALEFLMLAAQTEDPAPRRPTLLNQVSMIRTYAKNRCLEDLTNLRKHGGGNAWRDTMFPGDPGDDGNQRHFLLNKSVSDRHKNKWLRGATRLITTDIGSESMKYERHYYALDLLMEWEQLDLMPPLKPTHLTYAGLLSEQNVVEILHHFARTIQDDGYTPISPFDNRVFKQYSGGGSSGSRGKRHPAAKTYGKSKEATRTVANHCVDSSAKLLRESNSDGNQNDATEKVAESLNEPSHNTSASNPTSSVEKKLRLKVHVLQSETKKLRLLLQNTNENGQSSRCTTTDEGIGGKRNPTKPAVPSSSRDVSDTAPVVQPHFDVFLSMPKRQLQRYHEFITSLLGLEDVQTNENDRSI